MGDVMFPTAHQKIAFFGVSIKPAVHVYWSSSVKQYPRFFISIGSVFKPKYIGHPASRMPDENCY